MASATAKVTAIHFSKFILDSVTKIRYYSVMPFVKLDVGILNSTLWFERAQREIFITALLMAEPEELREPLPQLEVREIKETGFVVPPGWYGFVRAASTGIIHRALMELDQGLDALESLGCPDPQSRSSEFEGRRLVRVNGGFVILNYIKYRDRDYTAAERQKRFRERKKAAKVTSDGITVTRDSNVTSRIAEAEAYIKPTPRIPPPSNGCITVRDRRRLNEEIYRLQDLNCAMTFEEALETACARLMLPLDIAKELVNNSGMGDALKPKRHGKGK